MTTTNKNTTSKSTATQSDSIRTVSVIVPNYNYKRYLKKRLYSILHQTYPLHELIILDDCSTDGSAEYLQNLIPELQKIYPNLPIKFHQNPHNSGKAIAQWRKGFELATGSHVWIAEADDLSNRLFLAKVMQGYNHSGVVLSYTESMLINSSGLIIAPNFRWSRDREKTGHYKTSYIKDGKQEIQEIMAIRCTIPNVSSVVFQRDPRWFKYLDEALQFNQVGDWYFYAKILEHGQISYCHQPLNRFRIHRHSKTASSKSGNTHFQEVYSMHQAFMEHFDLSQTVIDRINAEEQRLHAKYGQNNKR